MIEDDPPAPLRRPLVTLVCIALAAGLCAQAGALASLAVWALALVWLARGVTRPPFIDRFVDRLAGGLGAGVLVTWLAVALLHAHTQSRPHRLFEGTWRQDAQDAESVRGHFEEGGGHFELPRGAAREGELLRLNPHREPATSARAPDFVRRRQGYAHAQQVDLDEVTRLAPPEANPAARMGRAALALRRAGLARIKRLEDRTTRGLAAALLFGDRSLLPRGLADLFTRTGTRHALAVSGLHVALVAALWIWPMGSLIAWLVGLVIGASRSGRRTQKHSVWTAPELWRAGILALLVPLAGSGAPVVRAALALSLAQLAAIFRPHQDADGKLVGGRRADGLSLWALALLFEWLNDPRCLASLSVLLSYGATLGLLLFARPALFWLRRHTPGGGRVAAVGRLGHPRPAALRLVAQRLLDWALCGLAASFAANLATLPVVWFVFGEWSWVGTPATLLLLPFLAAFLGLAWAYVLWPNALVAGWLDLLCDLQIALLKGFDALPGTPTNLPSRPLWALLAVALVSMLAVHKKGAARLALAGWSALILPWHGPARELEVHALDVGHGTAVVVRTPGGPTWLFDAGSRDRRGVARDALAPLLRELDVGRLVVVSSHNDTDHSGALPWLVERYPPLFWAGALSTQLAERLPHGTARLDLEAGRLELDLGRSEGALSATLIRGAAGEGNEGSRDLELRWQGRSVLLTGDAEGHGRARSLQAGHLRGPYDLLLFPHHGSHTPWLGKILAETQPTEIWISSGERPAVARELDRRGLEWSSTAEAGPLSRRFPGSGMDPAMDRAVEARY